MRSSGHAFAHWSQTMQVCAPVPGSVCRRSTPRNRGDVGRRSAGYWKVNAGCGVYLRVTHMPFSRSMSRMLLKNRMMVFIRSSTPLPDECGLAVSRHDDALLAEHGAFLSNLVLQPHQP